MPRYLFHLVSDCARVPDREGTDLADAGAACECFPASRRHMNRFLADDP
jgi:hypothetical protein